MSNELLASGAFVVLFALMLLRVPVGIAMALVGVGGFSLTVGVGPALELLAQSPFRSVTDESLGLVPLFILMGAFATVSGLGRELFTASNAWMGHFRGGLAAAAIWACAGFATICGSAVASAATMAKVVLPEMRRYRYDEGIACATIAVGGTLKTLIPPSIVLVFYGIMVEQDIAKLFLAGIVPGALAVVSHLLVVAYLARRYPSKMPAGERQEWPARWRSLRQVWAVLALFLFVLGGLYGGIFTPTEAAGMGALGALLIALLRRRMSGADFFESLVSSMRSTGLVFLVVIGAIIFGYFIAITRVPHNVSEWVGALSWNRYVILALILAIYFVLGALMDELAMILLTLPIVFPIIMKLGFDPIWFGVIIAMTVELGLIVPPVAMNLFVLHSIAGNVPLVSIFKAVTPFIVADLLRLALLCAFPILVTWLPSTMG